LPQDKEVPTRLANKASKEVLTQYCGKRPHKLGRFIIGIGITVIFIRKGLRQDLTSA